MAFFVIEDLPAECAFFVVFACWLGFGLILLIGKSRASGSEIRRDTASRLGFLVQGIGYTVPLVFFRTLFSPIVPMSKTTEWFLAGVTMAIGIASVLFCFAAAWALGRHWALVARVVEGHELITHGPYAVVRNPIYLAMLGMMIATGLAGGRWQSFVVGTLVFLAGSMIRIRSEEQLLRGAFGPAFEEYARRVPALLPWVF